MKTKKYENGGETTTTRTGIGGRTITKSRLSDGNYSRKQREVEGPNVSKSRTKTTVRSSNGPSETTVRKWDDSEMKMKSRKGIIPVKAKTGGMVNSNAKVSASKVAKGRAGGTSSAPKTAVPKAKYGMVMRKK